jgi:tuftelin-interacting protein 11
MDPFKLSFDASKLTKATAADYSSSDSEGEDDDDYRMPSRLPDDHDGEFADSNPRKRRRTGRNAKESAALGVFGSDSEDDRLFKRSKKPLRSKGVSFVSSAVDRKPDSDDDEFEIEDEYVDGKEGENNDDDDSDDQRPSMMPRRADDGDEDEDEDEDGGGVGLGFGGAAAAAASQGLGWLPPTQSQQFQPKGTSTPQKTFVKSSFDQRANTHFGSGFTPSSASEPKLKVKDDVTTNSNTAMPSAFSQGRGGKIKINKNSFGARLMAKMGYVEGKGLGKEEQGRNVIIEANLRPQNVGLGAVKEKTIKERAEEKRQQKLRGEVVVDSDEEEKKEKAARRRKAKLGGLESGTGSGASTPRRQKPRYMTLDEVKKAAPGLNIPDAFTPILDMTGPGHKLLTSSTGIMASTSGAGAAESVEEAESRKLVRRAQNDFMAILEEWKALQERKAFVELQLQQEAQELEELQLALDGNKSLVNACASLSALPESGELDERADLTWRMGKIISGLKEANEAFPPTSATLPQIQGEMTSLAIAAIHPTFTEYMQLWKPLEEPKPAFLDGLASISGILGLGSSARKQHRKGTASPWEVLMYKSWLPTAASAVREWNVRDSDQLLSLYEAWQHLMPSFVRAQLLSDIERKLEDALRTWEPKRRKHQVQPHLWIFPWLQYLPTHHLDPKSSTGLVADVKRKFRQLIDVWEFGRGVIPGFDKWKNVLRTNSSRKARGSDQWTPLVMNHLLPSMAKALRTQFHVNPADQQGIDLLEGVLQWTAIISPSMVGEVVVAEVFPGFHDALHRWLTSDTVDYDEVGAWLQWWQGDVFPEEIKNLASIQAEFDKAVELIEEALNLGDDVKTQLKKPERAPALKLAKDDPAKDRHHHRHHRHHHHHRDEQDEVSASAGDTNKPAEEVATFRHVMEDWCQENELQFIPERKRVHAEGPLYRITARGDGKGGVLVYFKGDAMFAEIRGRGLIEFRKDEAAQWEQLHALAG